MLRYVILVIIVVVLGNLVFIQADSQLDAEDRI
jgi:hypothetical protein